MAIQTDGNWTGNNVPRLGSAQFHRHWGPSLTDVRLAPIVDIRRVLRAGFATLPVSALGQTRPSAANSAFVLNYTIGQTEGVLR